MDLKDLVRAHRDPTPHARPMRPGDPEYPNYHAHRVALPPLTERELFAAYGSPAPETESELRAAWGDR